MSLMELLVVLVIVGVLLMVSLPVYNNIVLKGNRQIAMAELRQLRSARRHIAIVPTRRHIRH